MTKKKRKQKKFSGIFMKIVVIFCIAYAVRVVERGMLICEQQSISPASIVTAAISFFGAELGVCALKRIFAKEDGKKSINAESSQEKQNDNFQIPLG